MSFVRPTLDDLAVRIRADFVSRLTQAGAILRRAVVNVLSLVLAGAAHMLHGHLQFLSLQLFPDKSEDAYLIRQAALYGLAKTPPTFAIGLTVPITGVNGTVIPAGTVLLRADGAEYTVDADVTIAAGTSAPTITARVAGLAGCADAGTQLTLQSPIAGADSTITVGGAGLEDGTDQETTEGLRTRLLAKIAEPAHGGSDADWIAWAKEVPGITRAWVTRLGLGPGTVVVRAVRDLDAPGSIIPDAGELAALQAHLDEEGPAHCTVTAVAPVEVDQAYSIALTPNTTATRAAVAAELLDLTIREGAPGATILLSHIRSAIGQATGVTNYVMTNPVADVTHAANEFPGLGVITFT